MSRQHIGFYDESGMLKPILKKLASEHGKNLSELMREIIMDHIGEYELDNLSDREQEFIRVKKREKKEKLTQHVANYKSKQNTFLSYIADQIGHQRRSHATIEQVQEWLETMRPMFKSRLGDAWEEDFKQAYNNPRKFYTEYRSDKEQNRGDNNR